MEENWVAVFGKFDLEPTEIRFRGETVELEPGSPMEGFGVALTSRPFTGGVVSAEVTFDEITEHCGAELVLFSDPDRRSFLTAGIGPGLAMFVIRQYDGSQWRDLVFAGDRSNLKSQRPYHLRASLKGSRIALEVDGVHIFSATSSTSQARSQVGVFCWGRTVIKVRSFEVHTQRPKAFVVMQFGTPFDEIHKEVIKVVCEEFNLEANRADESYQPTMLVQEITQQIAEATLVIAEITPPNPNVYYELGYAHALGKPTILLADRQKLSTLPFDISAWRTLFYENSIGGKSQFEERLRQHLKAILEPNRA